MTRSSLNRNIVASSMVQSVSFARKESSASIAVSSQSYDLYHNYPFIRLIVSVKMMRQGANSAVRFTTYSTLKQFVQGTARPGQTLPSTITFGIGAIAGLVTVYTTMPLEYVLFS